MRRRWRHVCLCLDIRCSLRSYQRLLTHQPWPLPQALRLIPAKWQSMSFLLLWLVPALILYPRSLDPNPSSEQSQEQVVTPWDVQGGVGDDGKQQGIDYEKLIVQFGTRRIDQALLDRFERLTGHRPHIFLRRGMFFSHRYIGTHPAIFSSLTGL